ncbi:hypothetical protein LguiA_008873 [Lonicera macranthoides]
MSTTTPILEPPPQPAATVTQQAQTSHSRHGSIGPVIGVLAVITILSAIAIMIGRICSSRRIVGQGHYDIEGWAEAKCSSCIDGRVNPPLPLQPAGGGGTVEDLPAGPTETGQERKVEERSQ